METTMIVVIVSIVIGILGMCVFAYNTRVSKVGATLKSKEDIRRERESLLLKDFEAIRVQRDTSPDLINSAIRIKSSGKTHVANYTKYRYNGSSNRDVEVWHSPTNIWVQYYLMFSTPFEDSCIRYNGEDVTSYDNTSTTQQEASESMLSRSQYDGSGNNDSCDTVRSRSYYDDSYSSSSSSDSYSDTGSSSSSSSNSYD